MLGSEDILCVMILNKDWEEWERKDQEVEGREKLGRNGIVK